MRSHPTLLACLSAATLSILSADAARAQETAREAHADEAHYRYGVGGFIGATRVHGENEFTLGIEAGMALNRAWSIGITVERADRRRDSTLILAGAGWHPFGPGFRVQLGVGGKDPSGDTEAVFRVGLGWEKEIHERWFVKPYVAYDVISNEDNEGVLGVYFGRLF